MAAILIIDDDPGIGYMLSRVAEEQGCTSDLAPTLGEGLQRVENSAYDLVFLDVFLPDGNGLEALPRIKDAPGAPEVIIVTGKGDADGAELAISSGAWDYLEKTSSLQRIMLAMSRALKYRENNRSVPVLLDRHGIVGESAPLRALMAQIALAASGRASVLLTGETGTGKELAARAIHANSEMRNGEFVVVDCAALPKELAEAILFGNVKGAFTGAVESREGLVAAADKGTLFLDEIGELPLGLQKAFLRVLQERRYRPVGAKSELTSDFRCVAATNRNVEAMVASGDFRSDLLFRLKSIAIELPPLRARMEDLEPLATNSATLLCKRYGIPAKSLSPDFLEILQHHDWPGNIRELTQTMERALLAAGPAPELYPAHLPAELRVKAAQHALKKSPGALAETAPEPPSGTPPEPPSALSAERSVPESGTASGTAPEPAVAPEAAPAPGLPPAPALRLEEFPTFKTYRRAAVDQAEITYLRALLQKTNGRINKACEVSGLSRTRLYTLLKEHGISKKF